VRKLFQVALGIIAAIGGYLDIGDLVFNVQAGAAYRYSLLWAVPVGVVGIMVFAEMSGRVAAIGKKANFDLVRERYSRRLGTLTLASSLLLNLLTLAAELGGVALVLQYFFDASYELFIVVGVLLLLAASDFLPFGGIERLFGYTGLTLMVFIVAAVHLHPDWHQVAGGFVPQAKGSLIYAYFAVGLIAAALMPYEIYFYSSGAIEEAWSKADLGVNRANAIIGFGLGALLAVALLVTAAELYFPVGIDPTSLGTVGLAAEIPFGETGLVLALVGILFAVGGAAIDTSFSAAYNLCQYRGWKWGKRHGVRGAPRFTVTWLIFFLLGLVIIVTGIDPVELTEYAVVFSVVALPLTYLPVLLAGRDRSLMGEHANGRISHTLGWLYFALICVLAVVAIPLLIATNGGGG
jgi:Mn2+/Fe2+ NRAMP family transporter